MKKYVIWILGLAIIALIGIMYVRGQKSSTDTMMKQEKTMVKPTDAMMESTGTTGADDSMMKEDEHDMSKEDKMMEPTVTDAMMKK